ncbi:hypothetical protein KAH55_15065, partial [bacterium]|nr:hypothetical protein [bacterium]
MQRKFLLFILILAMSLHFACMDQQTNPLSSDELNSMPIIPQSTKILTASAWQDNFISVSSNGATYTFKAAVLHNYNMKVGNVLVGETDDGCILRRITAIKSVGAFVEVTTVEASLVEAVKRGSGKYVLDFQNLANGGLGKVAAVESLSVDFDETFGSGIRISGDFKLIPNMNGDFAIDNYTLQNFDMQLEAMGALNCLVEMNQGGVFLNTSRKLDTTFDFAEIIFMIGDIPVPVQPQVEFYLEPQIDIVAPLTLNYTSDFDYSIDLDYSKEQNSWNNESSIEQTAALLNHSAFSGDTECNVMIRPQIKLTIFGREITDMQTFFQEQATADLGNNAVTPGWKTQSIISAAVEANLDAISRQIPNFVNQSVFADTSLLAHNAAPDCELISPAEDTVITIGDTLNVLVLALDDHEEGAVRKVELLINNSVEDETAAPPYTLQWDTHGFSSGNYTLTARATDNDGLVSTATIQVTLTPI